MKMKKNILYFFCIMFVLIGSLIAWPETASAKQVRIPVISNMYSVAYTAVGMEIENMDLDQYKCEIYRSTSENGTYKKKCTISKYGVAWFDFGGYQCVLDAKGRVLYGLSGKTVTYTDYTVAYNQKYYYKIRYIEAGTGKKGAFSKIESCRAVLSKPEILQIREKSSNKVYLKWSETTGANGYIMYRKYGGKWKKYKTFSKNTLEYTDTNVKKGETYSYRIRAYRKVNEKNTYGPYGDIYKISLKPANVPGDYKTGSVYGPYLTGSQLTEIRKVAQSFKTNFIKSGMSDYQKVKMAHDYICANCSYAYEEENYIHTALGALVYGKAQCSGYSRAMKALCDAIGIPCYYVRANSQSVNPYHQWNQVKVDGKWYIVDVQANDSSGFYAYFLMSGDAYKSISGMRWNTEGLPATSKKNYGEK